MDPRVSLRRLRHQFNYLIWLLQADLRFRLSMKNATQLRCSDHSGRGVAHMSKLFYRKQFFEVIDRFQISTCRKYPRNRQRTMTLGPFDHMISHAAGRHTSSSIVGGILPQLRVVGADHGLRAAKVGVRKAHFVMPLSAPHVVQGFVWA